MKFVVALIATAAAMQISPNCVQGPSGCNIEGSPETVCACPPSYNQPVDNNCEIVTGGFGSHVCMRPGTQDVCPCPMTAKEMAATFRQPYKDREGITLQQQK